MKPTGEVHPVADLFPMMSDDELADLAADIAANGLIHPIVIDADGQLIDGRNRLAACRLAGMEPTFTSLNGHDPVAFIIGANVTRRHLSKGQAAMAVAKAKKFAANYSTLDEAAESAGVSHSRVAYSAMVLRYAPDLADTVLSGATSLDDAYTEARRRKVAAASTDAQMERLRIGAPDLVSRVVEGDWTLAAALGELDARTRKAEEERRGATNRIDRLLAALDTPPALDPTEEGARLVAAFDPSSLGKEIDISPVRLARCQALLVAIVQGFTERE